MTDADRFRDELADLSALLVELDQESAPWSPEWMNRQSLLTRDADLRHKLEVAEGAYQFELVLAGSPIRDGAIDVSFLGRFLEHLQMTVSTVAQAIMFGDRRRGPIGSDVLGASVMRLVATAPGSFVVAVEGPERNVQASLDPTGDDEEPLPVFDEAIERILDVIDVAELEVAGERLPRAVSALGGHRPISHMVEFAKLLATHGTAATAVERSPFRTDPREASLSAAGARRLETLLSRTEQSTSTVMIPGKLTGVRWRSSVFDLEPEDGSDVISGKIARDLRDDVRSSFDRLADVTVQKTITRTQVEGEETTTYELVEIRPRSGE